MKAGVDIRKQLEEEGERGGSRGRREGSKDLGCNEKMKAGVDVRKQQLVVKGKGAT